MLDFLPPVLRGAVADRLNDIFEIRIRANQPVRLSIRGNYQSLKIGGRPLVYSAEQIGDMVTLACENSLYAFNDCIKQGYLTKEGVRVGLCGRVVYQNGNIITLNKITSLCVRIPHAVKGCADYAFEKIFSGGKILNTLVLSPPGVGKTTLLRELTVKISDIAQKNVLVTDEKNELCANGFYCGSNTDILSCASKKYGFYTAVKNLNPDVIVVDELVDENDVQGALFAWLSGVSVVCSAHATDYKDALKKDYLKKAFGMLLFERIITIERVSGEVVVKEIIESERAQMQIDDCYNDGRVAAR